MALTGANRPVLVAVHALQLSSRFSNFEKPTASVGTEPTILVGDQLMYNPRQNKRFSNLRKYFFFSFRE